MIDKKLSQELKKIANCSVLSEEHKEDIGNTYFVIDPIDGTHNFDMKKITNRLVGGCPVTRNNFDRLWNVC